MRKTILFLYMTSVCAFSYAQKMLTVSDAVLKQRNTLAPEKLNQLSWMGSTNYYAYIDMKDNISTLFTSDAKINQSKAMLTITELNALLKGKNLKETKDFPYIKWTSATVGTFEKENKLVTLDLAAKTISSVTELPAISENAENMDKASNGNIAYTVDENLYVYADNKNLQVSKDGNFDLVYGKSVHREEFGIMKGTFWSPAGNLLAFYRMDQNKVTAYPIMEIGDRPATARMIKYPMAGDSKQMQLYI